MTELHLLDWWTGHDPGAMWDQHLLLSTLDRLPVTRRIVTGPYEDPGADGAIVVVPGVWAYPDIEAVNHYLNQIARVLVVVSSDEESRFPHEALEHPDMRVWLMYGRCDRGAVDRWLPIGFPPGTREILAELPEDRPHAWVFDGQVNHPRRQAMKAATAGLGGSLAREVNLWTATHGFAQGRERPEYLRRIAAAKVALCPSGPESPDSFRTWEALEAGTLPLVGASLDPLWWERLCGGGPPFPQVHDWATLPGHLADALAGWPANLNRASAWWQREKLRLHWELTDSLAWLDGTVAQDPITVLVSTSPVHSNPDTSLIENTVASVRERLPDAPIVLMMDGVRPEHEDRRAAYEEFTRRVLSIANLQWDRVYPIVSDEWLHQAAMTRRALNVVRSPLVLFVEHDTPLEQDIPFDQVGAPILAGEIDLLRFHFESEILRCHRHLMLDRKPRVVSGVPLVRTYQWSQRPHLASTAYYREKLAANFGPDARCFIEDVMVGVLERGFLSHGEMGWHRNRVAIYHPEGNIRRSHHTDGRGDHPKGRQRFAYTGETPEGAPAPRWVPGS